MTVDPVVVEFPQKWTDEGIVAWLMNRWRSHPNVGLHIPLAWREAVSFEEWMTFGHFPTFSVTGEAYALGPDGPIELYYRQRAA